MVLSNFRAVKFTHLVEINDPLNPLIETLSRSQLWRGLQLRAEDPGRFVPWLDACEVFERTDSGISRRLRYGDVVIRDAVTFIPLEQVLYEVPAQEQIGQSSLRVTIEEPQPGAMNVRFEYDDGTPDVSGSSEAFYNEFKRSAWLESDIDTIRLIRELAADGLLGPGDH
jgi:hypothetical protein